MVNTCQQRFNRHRTRAVGAVNGDNVRARLRQRLRMEDPDDEEDEDDDPDYEDPAEKV